MSIKKPLHSLLSLVVILLSGCGQTVTTPPPVSPGFLRSTNGKFELKILEGWAAQESLHGEADIQIADTDNFGFFVVISDDKSTLEDPSITSHAQMTRENILGGLADAKIASAQIESTCNGFPSLEMEITGYSDGEPVRFFHRIVDTGSHLHQLSGWSAESHEEKNRAAIKAIANTFGPVRKN